MPIDKPIYLQKIKQDNMATLLRTIWEQEAVSRVELVERTGLTSGTVTNLTQDLLRLGLIRESAASASSVGRKRINLTFDTERYAILGLDIGRTSYEVVLTDVTGRMLKSAEGHTVGIREPDTVIDLLAPHVEAMQAFARARSSSIIGMGVSIPGPMDRRTGRLLSPPNFPGWEHYPIAESLKARFGLPVWVEDDARACALAERWFGLGRNERDLLFVTMGMGIGGGVITNGELVNGANGLYGQVGHITLVPDGLPCACGNRGCWETIGSIPGILRRWAEGDHIDDFFRAVHSQDPRAMQSLKETLHSLESALATLFHTYDPSLIVLGGRLYPYLCMYMEDIRTHVKERIYAFARDRLRIEPASFGSSQNAVGAVALAFHQLLTTPLQLVAPDSSGSSAP